MEAGGVEGKLAVNGLPRRQIFTEYKVYPARYSLSRIFFGSLQPSLRRTQGTHITW